MNYKTFLVSILATSSAGAFTQTLPTNTFATNKYAKKICQGCNPASPRSPTTTLFSTIDRATTTVKKRGASSSLISNLAVIALKSRLAQNSGVACEVSALSPDILFSGAVGPVSVKGRGWGSPLGLTCRAIEANVEKCAIDINYAITKRKLLLTEPAIGKAMIALDTVDFGNFITHPLFKAQAPTLSGTGEHGLFEFVKEGVDITSNPNEDAEGVIKFYGYCLGKRWRCELRRGSGNTVPSNQAVVDVTPAPLASTSTSTSTTSIDELQKQSREISALLSTFFNALVFELDGVYLSFKDLFIHTSSGIRKSKDRAAHAQASHVLIALAIKVRKLPSSSAQF